MNKTVSEHLKGKDYNKIWLCPSLVSDGKIGRSPLLQGIECTSTTVPKELRDKKVRTAFNDAGFHCIIWEHEDDVSFLNINGLLGETN